ncbi:MAG: hypothetical protein AB7S38_15710 [Vulcanimicrobiota bacterium]
MSFLYLAFACLFGGLLTSRALKETSWLLILGTAPLLASAAIVQLANWGCPRNPAVLLLAVASLGLWFVPAEKPQWLPLTRFEKGALGLLLLCTLVYTHYSGVRVFDSDRYLHDSHIVAFQRGIYPPVNPFFPELAMNGHFGRDLLMSALTEDKADPVFTVWWVSPFLQIGALLTLFASTRVLTGSPRKGLLVAAMVFYGMDCGFRVGLVDTFDGSNALAYPHLVLLFHLMHRVLGPSKWPTWLVAGIVLGNYQLCYMTNFPLMLVTGLCLFVLKARTKEAWIGLVVTAVLAMTLAFTEGGAFTDLARRGLHPEQTKAVQNQGLRVTLQFPKEQTFKLLTTTADYYRTSVAYRTSLFKGLYRPPRGSGYLYIWDPRLLTTHWLPLYLAPLSLWLIRKCPLGLSYWIFAFISFIIPGLFYFGPIFEYEYFRWEYSAAFGFAAALGLGLGEWLEGNPIRFDRENRTLKFAEGSKRFILALLILFASLLAGEKLLNDAIIDSQKKGFVWFPSTRQWRLNEPTFQVTADDVDAAAWLRERTEPGSRILTNRLDDSPTGLWPDTVVAMLAGTFPAGHAFPPETEGIPHGNPAFHANEFYRAFWATGDLTVLEDTGVRWLVADLDKLDPKVQESLEGLNHQVFGRRLVAEVPPVEPFDPKAPIAVEAVVPPDNAELRIGHRYPLTVRTNNPGQPGRVVLKLDKLTSVPLRFTVPSGDHELEWSLVTPLDEGTYHASLQTLDEKELAGFDFTIDFLARLQALEAKIEFPQMKANRFYRLQGEWLSARPIHSTGELQFYYRFKRPDGDYAWEVDSIPQPTDLNLPEQPALDLPILTPDLPGSYELEFWFLDQSRRRVKLDQSFQVTVE